MDHEPRKARTVAEAEAQRFEPPTEFSDEWTEPASSIDGYTIAEELGHDLMRWAPDRLELLNSERPVEHDWEK